MLNHIITLLGIARVSQASRLLVLDTDARLLPVIIIKSCTPGARAGAQQGDAHDHSHSIPIQVSKGSSAIWQVSMFIDEYQVLR